MALLPKWGLGCHQLEGAAAHSSMIDARGGIYDAVAHTFRSFIYIIPLDWLVAPKISQTWLRLLGRQEKK
jgi:hypothetical protein